MRSAVDGFVGGLCDVLVANGLRTSSAAIPASTATSSSSSSSYTSSLSSSTTSTFTATSSKDTSDTSAAAELLFLVDEGVSNALPEEVGLRPRLALRMVVGEET